MGGWTVKGKFGWVALPALAAGATFLLSAFGAFPRDWVERYYAGAVFPSISRLGGIVSDSVRFAWLDLGIVAAVGVLVYSVRWRSWRAPLLAASLAYLWFFWTWGLNYHRIPVEVRLGLEQENVSPGDVEELVFAAASELNRLYPLLAARPPAAEHAARLAARQVRQVMSTVDGRDWAPAALPKRSFAADAWFRIAGIDGMFNPFPHEPVLASSLLDFEVPFVLAHELAHVRGVSREGEANLVALLATVTSGDAALQYSGWFHLWLYLRNSDRDELLDSGPLQDLQRAFERSRSQRVGWASNLQAAILDLHLKAHESPAGISSYSRMVLLAAAARKSGLM